MPTTTSFIASHSFPLPMSTTSNGIGIESVKLPDTTWAKPNVERKDQRIFIVDDEDLNIRVVRKYLRSWGYDKIESTNQPREAIHRIRQADPHLVLLDVMMPDVNGLELLAQLRAHEETKHLPIVILTAHFENSVQHEALELGANDFLSKPIDPLELQPRVRNLLHLSVHQRWLQETSVHLEAEVHRRTESLVAAQHQVIHCLARASEYRDNDTGHHIIRVGAYAALIARKLGLDDEYVRTIEQAAKLHDVGKIGIPDAILHKPGKLDEHEMQHMKTHCDLGLHVITSLNDEQGSVLDRKQVRMETSILESDDSPVLLMAAQIALTHHEKWDGSGYPFGLSGEQIPLEGRITAVADVFDALSSTRPYKPAFSPDKCREILSEGRGKHFDPAVLDAFMSAFDEATQIRVQYSDMA
jgi:putative two-component system response regulator